MYRRNPSCFFLSCLKALRYAFRFKLLPIFKVITVLVCAITLHESAKAQILYYQDSFFGGVTAGGYAPVYNGAGTGTIQLHIPANATIRKAILFAGDYHSLTPLTVTLNGSQFTFNDLNAVTPGFNSIYNSPATVHAIDVSNAITPSQQTQTLTIPSQIASPAGRFTDFYILVTYQMPTTFKTRVSVFLNQLNFSGRLDYTLPVSFHAQGKSPLGLAIYGGYICELSDGEDIRCNGNFLGTIYGPEPNSGICGGPFANFYYDNITLHGLGSDNEDLPMGKADALSDIRTLVKPLDNTLQLNTSGYLNSSNTSNSIWGVILVDGDLQCNGLLAVKPSFLNFTPMTLCSSKDSLKGYITNSGCDTFVIDTILFRGQDYSSKGFRTGRLAPGATMFYTIYLMPSQTIGGTNGSVEITWHSLHDLTLTQTITTIIMSGSVGYGLGVLSETSAGLHFLPMTICSSKDSLKGFITNTGCDSLVIDQASLLPGTDYSMSGLQTGKLAPGDTIYFTVYLTPHSKGAKNSSMKIVAHSLHTPLPSTTKMLSLTGSVGDGKGVLSAQPPTLNFAKKTICSAIDSLDGFITNTGCDTLIIDNALLLSSPGYSTKGLNSGSLAPGDTEKFIIYLTPQTKGTINGSIQIAAHSINNIADSSSITLVIKGSVGDGTGILAVSPASLDFAPMTICSSRDSISGFITNLGCDTLIITDASLIGAKDYSASGLQTGSIAPGDTEHFSIYLKPLTKGAKTGSVSIAAHSINNVSDSTFKMLPLRGSIGNGIATINFLSDSLNFGLRSLCVPQDSLITFFNSGCDTLRIDSATIRGLGFGIGTLVLPLLIPPGDTGMIPLVILLDTIGRKPLSEGVISIWGNDADKSKQAKLVCKYKYPLMHHIYLMPSKITATAGDSIEFELHSDEDLADTKTIEVDLNENTDLLEYLTSAGNNFVTFTNGHLHIAGAPMISNMSGTVAKLRFKVYLSADSIDRLTLKNLQLNSNEPTFTPCNDVLEENQSVFTYNSLCGDVSLENYLHGKLPFDNMSVHPNPAFAGLMLELDSRQEQDISIIISGALGQKVFRQMLHIGKGKLQNSLDVSTLASGTYTIGIEGAGRRASAHFIKNK